MSTSYPEVETKKQRERQERRERLDEIAHHNRLEGGPSIDEVTTLRNFVEFARGRKHQVAMPFLSTRAVARVQNAIVEGQGSAGGYLIGGAEVQEVVEVNRVQASAMRQVSRVERLTSGDKIFPKISDSGNEGRIITAANGSQTSDTSFKVGRTQGFVFSSDIQRVSQSLLRDASEKLTVPLFSVLARRVARRQNRSFTIGDAGNEPAGITLGCELGKTTASSTAIDIDEIIDLVASVDAEYDADAVFMCHKLVAAALFKLVDGNGRHLWEASGLSKIPIIPNAHMDSALTTGKIPLLYGNFHDAYVIVDYASELEMFKEKYVEFYEVGFQLLDTSDGHIADTSAVKKLVMA